MEVGAHAHTNVKLKIKILKILLDVKEISNPELSLKIERKQNATWSEMMYLKNRGYIYKKIIKKPQRPRKVIHWGLKPHKLDKVREEVERVLRGGI